jgi:photosystem II stability/assembly factor-like uncharacterized protein
MKPVEPAFRASTFALAALLGGTLAFEGAAAERIALSEVSHIHGIAVDSRDPSRLFLATHHGIFLTSPDATAQRVSEDRSDYMGFTPNPADPQVLFASGHAAGGGNMGFIVSRDGGATWTRVSPGADGPVDFHAMDVSAADPSVVYGLYGSIQVSRDAGKTWEVSGDAPDDIFDLAASALDANLVYAATRRGLMVSRDAGRSWDSTGPEGQPATMVQVGPNGTVYAFVYGTGLMKAPAAALSWRPVSTEFGERVLLHLAIDRDDPNRMFAVTDEGRVLASTNGGKKWTPLGS